MTQELIKTFVVLKNDCSLAENQIKIAYWPQQNLEPTMGALDIDDLLNTEFGPVGVKIYPWVYFQEHVKNLKGGPSWVSKESIERHLSYCISNWETPRTSQAVYTKSVVGCVNANDRRTVEPVKLSSWTSKRLRRARKAKRRNRAPYT